MVGEKYKRIECFYFCASHILLVLSEYRLSLVDCLHIILFICDVMLITDISDKKILCTEIKSDDDH